MRKWGVAVAVVGVLFLAAAAILRFVVVPGQAQLPGDESTTRMYEGTAAVALNAEALAKGDLGNALLTNVPILVQRDVNVVDTDGSTAIVTDRRTVTTADSGAALAASEDVYAIDRKDMVEAAPFGDRTVAEHEGLTISFPIGTDKQTYTGWQSDTQKTVPIEYVDEVTYEGQQAYVFTAELPSAPITNPAVLAALPAALPKTVLPALAQRIGVPAQVLAQLQAALPSLPSSLDLTYAYEGRSKYWVEPETGMILNLERSETRSVSVPALQGALTNVPVLSMSFAQTDGSIADAVDDATSAKDAIQLYGTVLPIGLGLLGLLMLAGAPLLYRRELVTEHWTEDQLPGQKAAQQ